MQTQASDLRYAPVDTSAGAGWYVYTEAGVILLETNVDEQGFAARAERVFGTRPVRRDPPRAFADRVRRCVHSGDGSVVDWSRFAPFQRAVLEQTARIGRGEVRSYGFVAAAIGKPAAVRAVGTALARNPVPLVVPCHRVVRSDGSIGEYGMGGGSVKLSLLRGEGYEAAARVRTAV